MPSEIIEMYHYDDEGWYDGPVSVQVIDGERLAPPNCTDVVPDEDESNWLKWNGESWEKVAKPATLADFDGLVVDHQSQSKHNIELRDTLRKLLEADSSSDYREGRTSDLGWYPYKVTAEEKASTEAQNVLREFDSRIEALKDRVLLAVLSGDEEALATVRTEYSALMAAPVALPLSADGAEQPRLCPACGHELDEDGNCVNEACPRSTMQAFIAEKRAAAEVAAQAQRDEAERIKSAQDVKAKPFAVPV